MPCWCTWGGSFSSCGASAQQLSRRAAASAADHPLLFGALGAAAGGQNTVEREGISIVHPAKFIMIGSGNPAEGELRPQLLDRFGLSGRLEVGSQVAGLEGKKEIAPSAAGSLRPQR